MSRLFRAFQFTIETKANGAEKNIVTGYASVFGNVDSWDDIMEPGSFLKTISERVPKMLVKFCAGHRTDVPSLLGTVVEAREDATGLWIKAQISDAPTAQDALTKMREGHLNRLSFAFDVIASYEENRDGKRIRHVTEVKLYEVSPVAFAANEEAVILEAKGLDDRLKVIETKLGLDGAGTGEPPTSSSARDEPTPSEPGEPLTGDQVKQDLEIYYLQLQLQHIHGVN